MTIAEIAELNTEISTPLSLSRELVPSFIKLEYGDKQRLFEHWQIVAPGVSPIQQNRMSLLYSGFLGFDENQIAGLIRAANNADPFAVPDQETQNAQAMLDSAHWQLFLSGGDPKRVLKTLKQIKAEQPDLFHPYIDLKRMAKAGGAVVSSMIDTVTSTLLYSDYAVPVPTFQLFSASSKRVAYELCQQNGER